MLKLLNLVTIIPDAIKGFFGWLNKKEDVTLEKYKVDGKVDVAAMQQDTEIIKARAELAKNTANDPASRIGKLLFILPVGVWFSLIVYDSAFRELIPEYTWRILALPPQLDYIPYAIVAYLFVTAWKK